MVAIESTLLTGFVLLVVFVGIGLMRDWERVPGSGEDRTASVVDALRSPMAWTVGFVVLALLFSVAAIAAVGGSSVIGVGQGTGELILLGGFGAVMSGFLFGGLYAMMRNRGLKGAQAAGMGSIVLGLLFVVGIAVKLLLDGG